MFGEKIAIQTELRMWTSYSCIYLTSYIHKKATKGLPEQCDCVGETAAHKQVVISRGN